MRPRLGPALLSLLVAAAAGQGPAPVPTPRTFRPADDGARLVLPDELTIHAPPELGDGALVEDWPRATGFRARRVADAAEAFVVAAPREGLGDEGYRIEIGARVRIDATTPDGVAWAASTLLQLARTDGGAPTLPRGSVTDAPEASWRGLLIDCARRPHDLATLYRVLDLCRLYKLNRLQLHLTDDQAFTFPSETLPRVVTPGRAYPRAELTRFAEEARRRGVVVVPEIEMPGHCAQLVSGMPELFRLHEKHHATINFASPAVDAALDGLIAEVAATFPSSPYLHLGCDEVDAEHAAAHPDFRRAFEEVGSRDVGDVFRRFIARRNAAVRRAGRRSIVWEGFGAGGKERVPADVTVMVFESAYRLPADLVAEGYPVINAAWRPLYVVGRLAWPTEAIRAWDARRFGHFVPGFPAFSDLVLPPTAPVVGAQLCAWEQADEDELPSLRRRAAAFAERTWNPDAASTAAGFAARASAADFASRVAATDAVLSRLIDEPRFEIDGLCDAASGAFAATVRVACAPPPGAALRATTDGGDPRTSPTAFDVAGPLTFDRTTELRTTTSRPGSTRASAVDVRRFVRIVPRVRYEAFALPHEGPETFFDALRTVTGRKPDATGELADASWPRCDVGPDLLVRFRGAVDVPVGSTAEVRVRAPGGGIVWHGPFGSGAPENDGYSRPSPLRLNAGLRRLRLEARRRAADDAPTLEWSLDGAPFGPVPWLPLSASAGASSRPASLLAEDVFDGGPGFGFAGRWRGEAWRGGERPSAPSAVRGDMQVERDLAVRLDEESAPEAWAALTWRLEAPLYGTGNVYRNFSPLNGGQHQFFGFGGDGSYGEERRPPRGAPDGTPLRFNDATFHPAPVGVDATTLFRYRFGPVSYRVAVWPPRPDGSAADPSSAPAYETTIAKPSVRTLMFNAGGARNAVLVVSRLAFALDAATALGRPAPVGAPASRPANAAPRSRLRADFDAATAPGGPLRAGATIAFVGDSLTWQGGFVEPLRALLEDRRPDLGVAVENHGVDGARSSDLAAVFARDVLARRPAVVVLAVGVNDVWRYALDGRGVPVDAYAANLRAMVRAARAAGALIVVATPALIGELAHGENPHDEALDLYAAACRQVAAEESVPCADWRAAFLARLAAAPASRPARGPLTYDGVHLTAEGNVLALETILAALAAR